MKLIASRVAVLLTHFSNLVGSFYLKLLTAFITALLKYCTGETIVGVMSEKHLWHDVVSLQSREDEQVQE
jgi:hypothetical protein